MPNAAASRATREPIWPTPTISSVRPARPSALGGRQGAHVSRVACAAAWLFTAACGFQAYPTAGSGDDRVDAGAVMGCAWAVHFDACALPVLPTQDLVLSGTTKWTFNTSGTGTFGPSMPTGSFTTRKLPQTGGGRDVLVLYTSAFTLGAQAALAVTGDKALVIAASSTIEIDGDLDVGSHTGNIGSPTRGPGASDVACAGTGGVNGDGASAGAGGGGGGALAANGGPGGAINNGDNPGGSAGLGVELPPFIRAGCAGGASGSTRSVAAAGDGGGAIELAARASITVKGGINAGGGGGEGGGQQQGGGGGGSGGIISLQAPIVTLASTALVTANGGAGGAGGSDKDSGQPGEDGQPAATSARGGDHGTNTAGGDGGALATAGGSAGSSGGGGDGGGGGGGGGGSVGYIMVRAGTFAATGAVVSPTASQHPLAR